MESKLELMERVLKNEGGSTVKVNKKNAALQIKTFTWPQLNTGDDQMNAGSKLTLFSDGTARFDAQTLCFHTHSGDTWQTWITVYDKNGSALFGVGYFDSPRMDDGNPPPVYTWSAACTFDQSKFDSADNASAFYSA